jgi:heterogeneous nuclear ribonucleoprotein A1/A3
MKDVHTGASRGFGFITFYRDDIAERLITEVQVAQIGNRRVDIRTADPKSQEKDGKSI